MSEKSGDKKIGAAWRGIQSICGSFGFVCLLALIGIELVAWLLPQRLEDDGRWYVRLASISLYVRVFQFHLGLGAIALAVWMFIARWRRSAALAVIVAGAMLLPYARDFAPKNPPASISPTFRLMSINLYFKNFDEAAIMHSIDTANPDVIVLIEVTEWAKVNIIRKHLLGRYDYVTQPWAEGAGIVMSRLPYRIGEPASNENGSFGRNPVLLNVKGTEVALYGVHLLSPGSAGLVERNRLQVTMFSGIARAETHPMIIAGDCNFSQLTPNAAAFHRAGLRSSHELVGFGLGDTWGPKWWPLLNRLPGVRIDHIWLSPGLTATSHAVGLDTGSDHRPVIADIGLTGLK